MKELAVMFFVLSMFRINIRIVCWWIKGFSFSVLPLMLCLVSLSACYQMADADGARDTGSNEIEEEADLGGETNTDEDIDESPDDDSETDSESNIQDNPDELELKGVISITMRHFHDVGHSVSAYARFMDLTRFIPCEGHELYLYEEQGNDACILYIYRIIVTDEYEGCGDHDYVDYFDAGEVTLHIEDSEFPMTRRSFESWNRIKYDYSMRDVTQVPEWFYSKTISVSATGAEVPAFTTASVLIPESHIVTSPEHKSILPKEAIHLEWSGGTGGEGVLFGEFFEKEETNISYSHKDIHTIRCQITDDGEFEIPAQLVEMIPDGYTFKGSIFIKNETSQVVSGHHITLYAQVQAQFEYQLEN